MMVSAETISRVRALGNLDEGSSIDQPLIVGDVRRCTSRKGSEYLRLVVSDRTANLPAVMWEPPSSIGSGPVLRVVGRITDHPRYGRQVVVSELIESNPEDVDLSALLAGPAQDAGVLERRLEAALEAVDDLALHRLLQRLLGPGGELRNRFLSGRAAKYNHHAYPGGLLEHTLHVADGVCAVALHNPAIDSDLALAGALLHDVGKLDAYEDDPIAGGFTDAGRLESEIPLGYYRIRRAIEQDPDFSPARAHALLHIILSHHGLLEHGSPVVPCTREAVLIHAMDHLSSRLGAFDRLERESAHGESWSRYDQVLETAAWIPARAGAVDAEPPPE